MAGKKSPKKSSKAKERGASSPSTDAPPPPSILRSNDEDYSRHMLKESTNRIEKLASEKERLTEAMNKAEMDTREVSAYLNREMQHKDEEILLVQRRLQEREQQLQETSELFAQRLRDQVQQLDSRQSSQEQELKKKIQVLEEDNRILGQFRASKSTLESELLRWKQQVDKLDERNQHFQTLMEQRFAAERERLAKVAEARIEQIRKTSKGDALKTLSEDIKRMIVQGKVLADDLNTQLDQSNFLKQQINNLGQENRRLQEGIAAAEEREQEYALKLHLQSKRMEELETRAKQLKGSSQKVQEEWQKEQEDMRVKFRLEINERHEELSSLKNGLMLMDKEIERIKGLNLAFLTRRTELEHFFLESLDQVKKEVRKRLLTLPALPESQHTSLLPYLKGNGETQELSSRVDVKVSLKDLTMEDRERVVKLLFGRMNAAHAHHAAQLFGDITTSQQPSQLPSRQHTPALPSSSEKATRSVPPLHLGALSQR
eukprot:GILI01008266.1.p1 GENE.GILI01008266.1~~GILI01008266.1.p1  ORF type:complete len:488 (+),score=155.30 GILI01008266.1:142-1605(+)